MAPIWRHFGTKAPIKVTQEHQTGQRPGKRKKGRAGKEGMSGQSKEDS